MSPEYGKAELKLLCNKFGFSFSEIKLHFEHSKIHGDKKGYKIVLKLLLEQQLHVNVALVR